VEKIGNPNPKIQTKILEGQSPIFKNYDSLIISSMFKNCLAFRLVFSFVVREMRRIF